MIKFIKKYITNLFLTISGNGQEKRGFDPEKFQDYLDEITHRWMEILYIVATGTHLSYIYLDYSVNPPELFSLFLQYRLYALIPIVAAFIVLKSTRPSRSSFLFGYLLGISSAVMIGQMTVDLGGFDTGYYAGMNIVIIGINLFLPWKFYHSALNGSLIVSIYVLMNFLFPHEYDPQNLFKHVYYVSTIVTATVIINYFHLALIKTEYILRQDLHRVNDKLWSDMELAKKIQISLLPDHNAIRDYEVASVMLPADEVGGDYFDIIRDETGKNWVAVGDVSGHGVESGLIMMMANTAIISAIRSGHMLAPSEILVDVNHVLYHNINRLKMERYMTLVLMRLDDDRIVFSGRHMDILVYRKATKQVEIVSEKGCFMGIFDDVADDLHDHEFAIARGDVILLYTDGVTEAFDYNGGMYGVTKLVDKFREHGEDRPENIVNSIIIDVFNYQKEQVDDITLLVMKRV